MILYLVLPLALFLQLVLRHAVEPLPPSLVNRGELVVEDADGEPLRELAGSDGLRARWVPLSAVPPALRLALVQSEDHRLEQHHGLDALGIARAAWLNLTHRRVISGGSTLAMQLARLVYGTPRTLVGKVDQIARAIVLQQSLGARGVLEAYVNLAPFGRDLRGVEEASQGYFRKPLRDLTRSEAVALACLPRAPSAYDPLRYPERLLRRRAHVLKLLSERGLLGAKEQSALAREPLHVAAVARPFRAPHAIELVRLELGARGAGGADRVRTTLDAHMQRLAERRCARAVGELGRAGASACAAVVMSVREGEVRALVGTANFEDARGGQVNAAVALRQPGSALKPFVYALAFEHGRTPETPIVDEETVFSAAFGSFVPQNYDRRYHGAMTLRRALACSYNVPAVKLAAELGPARIVERLRALGLSTLERPAEHYGVGLALGDGEVTLFELTAAYAALARGGTYLRPTLVKIASRAGGEIRLRERGSRSVFSRSVSEQVSSVLADADARRPAFGEASVLELPFWAAVKTGTSSNYRDNWALGYTRETVVGVWVGRHDGAPMRGISGVAGAAPALRDLLLAASAHERRDARASADLTAFLTTD